MALKGPGWTDWPTQALFVVWRASQGPLRRLELGLGSRDATRARGGELSLVLDPAVVWSDPRSVITPMPGAPQPYQTSWCGSDPGTAGGSGAPVVLLGVFSFASDGWIMGLKYFRDLADSFNHIGYVTDPSTGVILGTVNFKHHDADGSGPAGWETAYLHPRLRVSQFDYRAVAVFFGGSYFWYDAGSLTGSGFVCGDVLTRQDGDPYPNMQFSYTGFESGFSGSSGSRYGIDLVFLAD